jgi:hypothetical protein
LVDNTYCTCICNWAGSLKRTCGIAGVIYGSRHLQRDVATVTFPAVNDGLVWTDALYCYVVLFYGRIQRQIWRPAHLCAYRSGTHFLFFPLYVHKKEFNDGILLIPEQVNFIWGRPTYGCCLTETYNSLLTLTDSFKIIQGGGPKLTEV